MDVYEKLAHPLALATVAIVLVSLAARRREG